MKNEYTASEFRQLLKQGSIQVTKKRFKANTDDLFSGEVVSSSIDDKSSVKANKKVKNAKKILHDGMMFDSSLNIEIYKFLKANNIKFEREVKYELQPSFKKHGMTYRNLTWTADYYLPDYNIIIEGKGFATDRYKIVSKLFAFKYDIKVYTIKNKKEVLTIHEILKECKKQ